MCSIFLTYLITTVTMSADTELHAGKENLDRCADTAAFLSMLHHLDDPVDEEADPPELPERLAAKSLFRWEVSACCSCCKHAVQSALAALAASMLCSLLLLLLLQACSANCSLGVIQS